MIDQAYKRAEGSSLPTGRNWTVALTLEKETLEAPEFEALLTGPNSPRRDAPAPADQGDGDSQDETDQSGKPIPMKRRLRKKPKKMRQLEQEKNRRTKVKFSHVR